VSSTGSGDSVPRDVVEKREHPLERGAGRLDPEVETHEPLHWREKPRLVRGEGHEAPHAEPAIEDPVAAQKEHRESRDREQHPGDPRGEIVRDLPVEKRPHETIVLLPESGSLTLLLAGRDGLPHPEKRLHEKAPDVGAPLADVAVLVRHPLPEMVRDPDRGHDEGDAHQEQAGLEVKKDEDRASEEDQVREEREKGVGGDPLHLGDVVVEAGEDVSHGNGSVEARRQALEVAEDLVAHVEERLRRDLDVTVARQAVEGHAQDRDQEQEHRNPDEEIVVAREERVVDEYLQEIRLREPQERPQHGDEEHEAELLPIGKGVAEGAAIQAIRARHGSRDDGRDRAMLAEPPPSGSLDLGSGRRIRPR
jgi:hypothetical protein